MNPIKRVFGLETEYGIVSSSDRVGPEQAARKLFQPLLREYGSTNVFAPNGGRIYLDVGAHPEYATAECASVKDLVAQDLAGMRILAELCEKAADETTRIHLLRNNVDSAGNGFGCHENYLLYRSSEFRDLADDLITFLVTRQIIVGAGGVVDGRWVFSERSHHLDDVISAATTRSRPIINTRDEPLANHELYRRLHVISGDSNMCGSTTALKVAITLAVLDTYQVRGPSLDFGSLRLADPMSALIEASYDANAPLALANGSRASAVQIQQAFHTACAGQTEAKYAELWADTIEAAASGNTAKIRTRIDWAIKKDLVDAQLRRSGADLDSLGVRRLMLAYHDITSAGLVSRLAARGQLEHGISEAQISAATKQPPTDTRAHARGKTVRLARQAGRDLTVDWNHLRLRCQPPLTLLLADPFDPAPAEVKELWQSLQSGTGEELPIWV